MFFSWVMSWHSYEMEFSRCTKHKQSRKKYFISEYFTEWTSWFFSIESNYSRKRLLVISIASGTTSKTFVLIYAENGHRSRYRSSISVGIVLNRHHNSHFQCYNSIIRCQKCTQVTSVVQFPAKLTITLKYLSVHSSLRVNWEHRCFSGQHFVPMERLFRN